MLAVSITMPTGSEVRHGIIMIFSVNSLKYAATIPVNENDEPLRTDVSLFSCTVSEDGTVELFDISSETEYTAASDAFSFLCNQV